ncbi:secreted RxLR effector protein 78-like [Apium graveolens]|uniref:secreted RxLR effector protein 78-like n=1 Tax=Apium graveolens TaxID=4045 RepID=UPI003D7AF98A
MLDARINSIYEQLINMSQFGFVKGRQAAECIFVVTEVYHSLKFTRSKGLILKLDFVKAFDTVNWGFLFKTMECMGLGCRWIQWMEDFFKTIRLSVLVNGFPTSEFKILNGVRQGDPLSPMLFNLVGEVLNKLLTKASEI